MLFTIFRFVWSEACISKFMSPMKSVMEKFDEMINFGMWQVQTKDILVEITQDLERRPNGGASKKLNRYGLMMFS